MLTLLTANAHYCDTRPQPAHVPTESVMPTYEFVDGIRQIVQTSPSPVVLCSQEVMEHMVDDMASRMGMPFSTFAPMHHMVGGSTRRRLGLAIFSTLPFTTVSPLRVYSSFGDLIPDCWDDLDFGGLPTSAVWQEVTVNVGGTDYHIGNTHFMQSPGGKFIPQQEAALDRLLATIDPGLIDGRPPRSIVWCGDMNMPRGRAAGWDEVCRYFTDNVPAQVDNSLDPKIHNAARERGVRVMVDGIFSTPDYRVDGFRTYSDLSDHLAFGVNVAR